MYTELVSQYNRRWSLCAVLASGPHRRSHATLEVLLWTLLVSMISLALSGPARPAARLLGSPPPGSSASPSQQPQWTAALGTHPVRHASAAASGDVGA